MQHSPVSKDGQGTIPIALELTGITHRYGTVVALDNVSLCARKGEFVTILGESGSGKTTLLKLISGIEQPTEMKTFKLGGVDIQGVPANLRDCATVFQSYALFPHMSVGQNVEYGLKVRGVAAGRRRKQALEALELVQLSDKYDRMIHQLSGGQRQRVALARAIVLKPEILLLDEPLGALDERLRIDMQTELMAIQRTLGITFIYITHSQEEALTMSDRILLMRHGKVMQEGTPVKIFDRPNSEFVARFMGIENVFRGELLDRDEHGAARVRVGQSTFEGMWSGQDAVSPGDVVVVCVRAERIKWGKSMDASYANGLSVEDVEYVYKGKYQDLTARSPIGPLRVRLWDKGDLNENASSVAWRKEDCVVTNAI